MSQLSVLIAEPSKTGRHIFAQLMSRMEISVTFTTTARETYSTATKQCFNLICLAQKLPDADGITVCAKLRKMERYRTTAVLLVTPHKSTINYDHAFGSGVTQLIGRHELNRFSQSVSLMLDRNKLISGDVLVIEDSSAQAKYIVALLSSIGLNVTVIASGEDAIKALSTYRYDLALVDIVLAGSMTGLDLVEQIRHLKEPYNRVRVLAMSGYEDAARRIKLFNLGIDDFINKPIIREELIARVRGLLSQHYIASTVEENQRLSTSLSQLLDNSPDMIARFDIEGRLLFMNPRMEAELMVSAKNQIGKHFSELGLSQEAQLIYHQAIEKMRGTKQVVRFQISGKHDLEFDVQFAPEVVADDLVAFICSARDITPLTHLQKQLLNSKQELEQALEAKTRFLATMSHELRTPLNAISGFEQLMQHKLHQSMAVNRQEFAHYLRLIGQNSHNLTSLIDDVLHLSQIETGKLSANLQLVDLYDFVSELELSFKQVCEQRHIQLLVSYHGDLGCEVTIDKVKTYTMVYNLIDNAIKYSDNDSNIMVNIHCVGDQLTFEVIDQGIGIPESFKDKLYLPFEQLDNSSTRDYGGIGLGLAIVREFALFLGGNIEISSREGEGTVCILKLPNHTSLVVKPEPTRVSTDRVSEIDKPIEFVGQRILVVEDSVVNQQLMTACLTNYGLVVEIAENGIEGVRKAQSWRPNLILMDMHMPKMDGLEATATIRGIEELKTIPVFALSADVQKEYIQKAYQSGVDEYLTKPVDFNQLCRLLDQYFQQKPPNEIKIENKESLMSESSVLDVEKGISFAANNEDLFKQLLSTFIQQYDQSGSMLLSLYQAGSYDEAMKYAHTMKGVCSTLGMDPLSEVAKTLQFAFANEELTHTKELIDRYQVLLEQALDEASRYCE